MTSIGEKLREERRRRNLDLVEVADQTRIRPNFLEAIEAEAWDRLPGKFFVKSFVRQYARALGMDVSEIDAEVEKLFEVEETASVVKPSPRHQLIPLPPFRTQVKQHGFRKRRWLTQLVSFVGVGLLCYGTYRLWQSGRKALSPPAKHTTTSSPVRTGPAVSLEPERRVEDGSLPYVPRQGLPPENPPALPLPEKLLVNLVATEKTWVSLRVDGRDVFSGILSPGDRRSFEGTGMVRLHTGNAAGLEIQWNGKPVGSIGRRGEVCFVEFTREGFQIRKVEM